MPETLTRPRGDSIELLLTTPALFPMPETKTQTIEEVMQANGHPKPGYTGGLESGGYSLRRGLLRFKVGSTLMSFRQKGGTWQKA